MVVDSIEQAKMEAGDLVAAHGAGRLNWEQVVELSAIVSGRTLGRHSPQDGTLFQSQGLAIEDLAVAAHPYRQVSC